jgi:hypothetical protein
MPQTAQTMRPPEPLSERKDIQYVSDHRTEGSRSAAPGIMTLHEKLQLGMKANGA